MKHTHTRTLTHIRSLTHTRTLTQTHIHTMTHVEIQINSTNAKKCTCVLAWITRMRNCGGVEG